MYLRQNLGSEAENLEFGDNNEYGWFIVRTLTNVNSENRVRSTGLLIHLSWPCVSNRWAWLEQTHYIIESLTLHLPRPNNHCMWEINKSLQSLTNEAHLLAYTYM